ncbi:MAG: cyclase family protein [Acidobacteriales bacterium]|nr:cyclase family protein [Terriglobales bacterium]
MARFIDLTHALADAQPGYPGDPEFHIRRFHTLASAGFNVAEITASTHQGTHLDAPYHFFDDGATVDSIPLDRFCGEASLVDLAPHGALAPRTGIGIATLEKHADAFVPGARILLRTGWDRRWHHADFFTDHPSLTLDAAHWIASRRIALLGLDTPSPSVEDLEVHRILLDPAAQIVIVESLANLEQLPPRFTFIGFPLRLDGCDGSPIRAVALCGEAR